MIRFGILIILLFFFSQTYSQLKSSIALQFNYAIPEQDFESNITRHPIGGVLSYAINSNESRWQFGFELGVGFYSGKKYFYETIDEGVPDNFERLYEENGFISYHTFVRYFLRSDRKIDVYLEGKIGASTFFSAIRTMQFSDVFSDRFLIHDTALNVGAGGGLQFNIGRFLNKTHWKRELLLDFSMVYLLGTEVSYRNSVKNEIVDSFQTGYRKSSTNMIQSRTGFVLRF